VHKAVKAAMDYRVHFRESTLIMPVVAVLVPMEVVVKLVD
jgi:hypothetical protein